VIARPSKPLGVGGQGPIASICPDFACVSEAAGVPGKSAKILGSTKCLNW
jgi:hypothetical protein